MIYGIISFVSLGETMHWYGGFNYLLGDSRNWNMIFAWRVGLYTSNQYFWDDYLVYKFTLVDRGVQVAQLLDSNTLIVIKVLDVWISCLKRIHNCRTGGVIVLCDSMINVRKYLPEAIFCYF